MNLGDAAVEGHVEKTEGSGVLCVDARPQRGGMRVRKRVRAELRTEAPRNPCTPRPPAHALPRPTLLALGAPRSGAPAPLPPARARHRTL